MKTLNTLLVAASLLGGSFSAQALSITPATPSFQGFNNGNLDAAAIGAIVGDTVTEVYKQNVGENFDTGTFAANYTTSYTPNGDESGFTITWVGPVNFINTTPVWLYVKNGNQPYYIFNLTGLGWNGKETITGSLFYPQQGSISHIALYAGDGPPPGGGGTPRVPDGGMTITLLGTALLGLGALRRKLA